MVSLGLGSLTAPLYFFARRDCWGNPTIYAFVNILFFLVRALGDRGHPWFLWVLGPWTIITLLYYLVAFVFTGNREKRAIEQEVERIKKEES